MTVTPLGLEVQLPRSHCFISIAHGSAIRTVRIRSGLVRVALALAFGLVFWTVAATLYLIFHHDLLAALMSREARMQYAYEDRIAALRGQVEHAASLSLVGQSSLDNRLKELTQRARSLEARASLVAQAGERVGITLPSALPSALAEGLDAGAMGPGHGADRREAIDNPLDADATGSIGSSAPTPNAARPPTARGKPRPEAANGQPPVDRRSTRREDTSSLQVRVAAVAETLEHIDAAQYQTVATLGEAARRKAELIWSAIASAGIGPERFAAKTAETPMGGPFEPLDPSLVGPPFRMALVALQSNVSESEDLLEALPHVPFAKPLSGSMEVTSSFGPRLDPFLGRPAMHTGVDVREDFGTDVRATAAGRVVSAGTAGGYGTMIEIDHGHGLSTRYAHLSAVAVHDGQSVEKGEIIGQVGATGRATGPHLHYETRIDGEAVDPMRFLTAGERLASLDPGL